MRFDLTDLEVFLAVAEEGSVTRGAQRCHLAPSSVSLRVKGLEEIVGVALLQRFARGVVRTAAGRIVMEHARRCVAQMEQMNADLLPFTNGLIGHVTLFANNNAIGSHLPDDLARFFEAFPNVRISLEERLSHDIVSAVASGRADLGIVALEAVHPDLDFFPYREDELVVVAPRGSDIGRREKVAFADCLSRPFISLQPGAALHTFLMNHAGALGGRLDVRVQVSSYGAIVKLVSSGAGIGIVARSAVAGDTRSVVSVIRLAEAWARRDLRVCVLRNGEVVNPFRDRLLASLCQPDSERHGTSSTASLPMASPS
ncbi:LysR family transcriptional regulator [Burkholderia gladioli]|uniref:LysR family transcriptional regulator n=1 Tax=Burkholderia gladioli TaxID=28095 RepID=UPI000BBCFBB0|nr:LysR family transcriptional regulator [Burkholderia gladioli]ATF88831.1 LysR family transcriptional regulator [Burkholderia gladioli pv. gladioli]MBJ9714759.1 LysR family transcriptional regulator [Burkholderia gladioli]MBU9158785.1 LysR family transcriptional regulator [Burkholderia gladioli]MDR8088977.1 LysR family transcriptional regulator [Burkholderia gladioli]MDZ4039493.1 LysR family transcriptional regulator [Burkholderia gladioli pv. alliicola]